MQEDHLLTFPSDRAVEKAIIVLKKGSHLLQYIKGKQKFCSLKLSDDEKHLIWYSGEEEKHLRLSSVSKIVQGHSHKYLSEETETRCFSIVYGNQQYLDLICKDKAHAETWILGLRALMSRNYSPKLLDSFRNQRGSQSCINSPAGFSRRKEIRGLKVHDSFRSPTLSISQRCYLDASPPTSDILYTESTIAHAKGIMDILIPKSSKYGGDEESCWSSKEDFNNNIVSKSMKPVYNSLSSSGKQVMRDVFIWGEGVNGGFFGRGEVHTDAQLPKLLESAVMLDTQMITLVTNHASLVTKQGEIFCWGEAKRGRLGHKVDMDTSSPKLVDSLAGINIKYVACSEYQSCALSVDGELYTWGDNGYTGDFVGEGKRSFWLPQKICGPLVGVTISHVACGEWHTAIVSTSGSLYTYGDGTFGVLGHGDLETLSQPKEVESLKGLWVKSVACGPWHTAAIVEIMVDRIKFNKPGGKLFTWGDGDKGRLGHADQTMRLLPTCVSGLVDHDFVQVSCGRLLTVGLSNNGKVYTMGSTVHGQLGTSRAIALTSKGTIYTWGRGSNGQLGLGDTEDRNSPTLVETLRDRQVLHITCGSSLTAAICSHKSMSTADQSTCKGCNTTFGFTRKKHNCYNCGQSACHTCSSKKARNASLAPNKNKSFRVCDQCFNQLQSTARSDGLSKLSSMSPRPFLIVKKVFSGRKEDKVDTKTTCRQTESVRSNSYDITGCNNAKLPYEGEHLLRADSHALGVLSRWGQVPCPEVFPSSAICLHQSQGMIQSSPANNTDEEFSQPIHCLSKEVDKLKYQVESLKKLCRQKDQKILEYEQKVKEVWMLAKDEAYKNKAAKEIIRDLTLRLRLMSENGLSELEVKDHPIKDLRRLITHSSATEFPFERNRDSATGMADNSSGMKASNHEWVEQYRPGVYVTLTTTSGCHKELKRVRFSRKRFSEEEAQRWWNENQLKVYHSYEMDGYKIT
ncbi:hypothetical protein Leryth_006397 [Lithospermum erythrorhizon]|nr:hypothetical protein Leryth_006397 [Lithospermum erythrorhizon]